MAKGSIPKLAIEKQIVSLYKLLNDTSKTPIKIEIEITIIPVMK